MYAEGPDRAEILAEISGLDGAVHRLADVLPRLLLCAARRDPVARDEAARLLAPLVRPGASAAEQWLIDQIRAAGDAAATTSRSAP